MGSLGPNRKGTAAIAVVILVLMASSSVVGAVSTQASQAIAGSFAGFAAWAGGAVTHTVDSATSLATAAIHDSVSNAITNKNLSSNAPSLTVIPQDSKVIQTQGDNFRIQTHLVTTATSYVYVTPGGNYSFSKSSPYTMSLTWLNGNLSSPLSEFNVIQNGTLSHGTSVVMASQTSYEVDTAEVRGSAVEGHISVSYNFSSIPPESTATYAPASAVEFNIEWVVVGGNYASLGSSINQSLSEISAVASNSTLGSGTSVRISHSSKPSTSNLEMNVNKVGMTHFVYGHIHIDNESHDAVAAVFNQNVMTVDPSLIQEQTGNGGFPSNVTAGDVLIGEFINYGTSSSAYPYVTGDSAGFTWSLQTTYSLHVTGGYLGPYGYIDISLYSATATSTTSDSVYVVSPSNAGFGIALFEVSGISATVASTEENEGESNCYPCGTQTYTTSSSTSFTNYGFLLGGLTVDQTGSTCSAADTGYSYQGEDGYVCGSNESFVYSTSGASSPTNYGQTAAFGSNQNLWWMTIGVAFPLSAITQPTTTTASGVSTGTVDASGCGVSPTSFTGSGTEDLTANPSCAITLTAPTGDVWSGTGTTTTETTCAVSLSNCSTNSFTYEPVTQPITATRSGSGSNQTISVSGCSASPTSFWGDGSPQSVTATTSCTLTLSLPPTGSNDTYYIWEFTGTTSITVSTCDSASCGPKTLTYMEYVQPINNPSNIWHTDYNLFNLTGSVSSVTVTNFDSTNNSYSGSSCGAPPCTPNNGVFSYQFNVELPSHSDFFLQNVVEFDLATDVCYAHAQSASGSPGTPTDSFICSAATSPGDYFEWIVDTTGGYFTQIEFMLNGHLSETWTEDQIFDCTGSCVTMYNAYAQSVWAGNESSPLAHSFSNAFSGSGIMSYSGLEVLNCDHSPCADELEATAEYSNVAATNATDSLMNQTYYGGSYFLNSVSSDNSTHAVAVADPTGIVGPPDGEYALLWAPNSGDWAWTEDSFGTAYNGTFAIYGYSANDYSSQIVLEVSKTGLSGSWTTVYNGLLSDSSGNTPTWIPLASVTDAKFVNITAEDTGLSSKVYIDAASLYLGSFAQSVGRSHANTGSVLNDSLAVGVNDGESAELEAHLPTDQAILYANLGTAYSGRWEIDAYSKTGYDSTIDLYISETNTTDSWVLIDHEVITPGSLSWLTLNYSSYRNGFINSAQYLKIVVSYENGEASDLFIDAIYVE